MTQRPLWPGTAARAAASGFQSRRRQLFWGSMQCPVSKDLAVGATGSVLGSWGDDLMGVALWNAWVWLFFFLSWMIFLLTFASQISLKVDLIH